MWTTLACLGGSLVAVLVVVTKLAIEQAAQGRRLAVVEAAQRKSAAENWDEETTVYSVKGVPSLNRMPWRIRAQWFVERSRARLLVWWRKLLNL